MCLLCLWLFSGFPRLLGHKPRCLQGLCDLAPPSSSPSLFRTTLSEATLQSPLVPWALPQGSCTLDSVYQDHFSYLFPHTFSPSPPNSYAFFWWVSGTQNWINHSLCSIIYSNYAWLTFIVSYFWCNEHLQAHPFKWEPGFLTITHIHGLPILCLPASLHLR